MFELYPSCVTLSAACVLGTRLVKSYRSYLAGDEFTGCLGGSAGRKLCKCLIALHRNSDHEDTPEPNEDVDFEDLQPGCSPAPGSEHQTNHEEEGVPVVDPIAEVGGSLASVTLDEKGHLYRQDESTLEPILSERAEDMDNLRKELSPKEAEISESHDRISDLEAQIAHMQTDRERLGQQLEDKAIKLTRLQDENRELKEEMESMKRRLADKEQDNANLQEQLHEAEEVIGSFKKEHEARISRLEEGHRELECKVADSNEMLQKYSSEIKDLKVELSEKNAFIRGLELKVLEERFKQERRQSQAIRELEKLTKDLQRQLRPETDEDNEVMTKIPIEPGVLPPAYT